MAGVAAGFVTAAAGFRAVGSGTAGAVPSSSFAPVSGAVKWPRLDRWPGPGGCRYGCGRRGGGCLANSSPLSILSATSQTSVRLVAPVCRMRSIDNRIVESNLRHWIASALLSVVLASTRQSVCSFIGQSVLPEVKHAELTPQNRPAKCETT